MISDLCFGKPLGFVEHQEDMHDFLQTLESRLPIVEQFSVITEFNTLLVKLSNIKWLKANLIPNAKDRSGVGKVLAVGPTMVIDTNEVRAHLPRFPRQRLSNVLKKASLLRTISSTHFSNMASTEIKPSQKSQCHCRQIHKRRDPLTC